MDRIIFMVLRNIYRAPFWFYRVVKMGREDAACTEQERYGYIRRMVEEERAKLSGKGKNYLLSHADQDTRSYLEEMRLGTEKGQEKGEEKTAGSPSKGPGRPHGKKR